MWFVPLGSHCHCSSIAYRMLSFLRSYCMYTLSFLGCRTWHTVIPRASHVAHYRSSNVVCGTLSFFECCMWYAVVPRHCTWHTVVPRASHVAHCRSSGVLHGSLDVICGTLLFLVHRAWHTVVHSIHSFLKSSWTDVAHFSEWPCQVP